MPANPTPPPKTSVVIAMSGGVDSSVAAALLLQQGYHVTGMLQRLWTDSQHPEKSPPKTQEALDHAQKVAEQLGIQLTVVDTQRIFRETVVQAFLDGYAQGLTPNPCLVCNRYVRWDFLLGKALETGADYLATGHYARLSKDASGHIQLQRGIDLSKDQSYVLYMLNQRQLKHTLFPLGAYTKIQVRELARRLQLPVAERSESQDLCFLESGDYKGFLRRFAPQTQEPGPIVDRAGNFLGQHNGLANYTIGQRKGIRIAAPKPYYVISKDLQTNSLVIGELADLGSRHLTASQVNWISGKPPSNPQRLQIKVRYKARDAWGLVTPTGDHSARVSFEQDVRDITPGQAVVFYQAEICLGGGTIDYF